MALKSTIFRAGLTVSDLDRQVYGSHQLTLARHPSETDERMMVRVLAFALNADDDLAFGAGLSTDDEPDLWLTRPDGTIEHWIEVGQPDPKRLRQALGRADAVTVYGYGGSKADLWWARHQDAIRSMARPVTVIDLPAEATARLADLVTRGMALTVTVQDGRVWVADDAGAVVELEPHHR